MMLFELMKRRKLAGLTQVELADVAGVSPITVSRVERGAVTPDTATMQKLATALSVSVADLFPELLNREAAAS